MSCGARALSAGSASRLPASSTPGITQLRATIRLLIGNTQEVWRKGFRDILRATVFCVQGGKEKNQRTPQPNTPCRFQREGLTSPAARRAEIESVKCQPVSLPGILSDAKTNRNVTSVLFPHEQCRTTFDKPCRPKPLLTWRHAALICRKERKSEMNSARNDDF